MRFSYRRSLAKFALVGVLGGCSATTPDEAMDQGAANPNGGMMNPDVDPAFMIGPTVPVRCGLPDGTGPTANYIDKGTVPDSTDLRLLVGFQLRDQAGLELLLRDLYDPQSPKFRAYLSAPAFLAKYGPSPNAFAGVEAWLLSRGLQVPYKAKNRLLMQVRGTAAQVNSAFGMTLRKYDAAGTSGGVIYYGTTTPPQAPKGVADSLTGLLVALPVVNDGPLDPQTGSISTQPPTSGTTLAKILQTYKVKDLAGFTGQGVKIGLVAGGAVRNSDVQSFWQGQGVHRKNPIVRTVLDPPGKYNEEATLDTQWAGAVAPDADVILYQGPDVLDGSVAYLFNEAIGAGEVQLVSTSFSHNEQQRHPFLRNQQNFAAMMAAALGITVMAASGDSAVVDIPATCPYVTAVGGTVLSGSQESAWVDSGSGISDSFAMPWYQASLGLNLKIPLRVGSDLALNVKSMVYYFGGAWHADDGTSFASPAFAGMMAVVNSARAARQLPYAGFLNSLLYTKLPVQQTFRDITTGSTNQYNAGAGWDYPTGWGSPNLPALAAALP